MGWRLTCLETGIQYAGRTLAGLEACEDFQQRFAFSYAVEVYP